jgi:hypothetical protein
MELQPESLPILIRIWLQTLALSALFVFAGQPLVRVCLPPERDRAWSLGFRYGSSFFLGLSAFLALFVALSRIAGSARFGLGISLGLLAIVAVADRLADKRERRPLQGHILLVVALLIMAGAFTVSNATLWLEPRPNEPSPVPAQLAHFGSLHSGRYAKYCVYVAEHDRIPFVPQNMGQCLLATVHLLIGSDAPLAALMAWVPFVMAGLACLIFGFLQSSGLTAVWAATGTFFVLYCNIALSLVSAVVLDCGSPLGFAGYSDITLAAGTLLLAAVALRGALLEPSPRTRWTLLLPALLGLAWCWYGPQNIVIAGVAVITAVVICLGKRPAERRQVGYRLAATVFLFAIGIAAGAVQLGTFLPQGLREDVGQDLCPIGSKVHVRPYVQYVTTNWTSRRVELLPESSEWIRPRLYETEYRAAKPHGQAAVVASMLRLFETHLLSSWRIYGFLLLGLGLMGWRLRRGTEPSEDRESLRVWFWLALAAFLTGYVIVFGLELGGRSELGNFGYVKWWLTRFLVPACVLCLTGLVLAVAPPAGAAVSPRRRLAWGLILVLGCFGPMLELSGAFWKNWIQLADVDPLPHRLNLLARVTGSAWAGSPFAK